MIITDLTRDDTHFDSFLKLIKESYGSNHNLKMNHKRFSFEGKRLLWRTQFII